VKASVKKSYLSGDNIAFDSQGKQECRDLWNFQSRLLAEKQGRELNYLWLANNQLSDIIFLLDSAKSFTIPDNNPANRAEKRRSLVNNFQLPKKNDFIKVLNGFNHPDVSQFNFYDVVNLDTCNHLDVETKDEIDNIIKYNTGAECLFFASFAQWSMKGIQWRNFPKFKRIAKTQLEIEEVITSIFTNHSYKFNNLPGFPFTYKTGARERNMHTFGWKLTIEGLYESRSRFI
jgi:hypothetical protein